MRGGGRYRVARPGSASAALGNAVVLRMNNMEYLQAGHRRRDTAAAGGLLYMSLRRMPQPRYAAHGGGRVSPANSRSMACGPEQDHEQDADHAQHGKTGWSSRTLMTLFQSQGAVPSTQVRNAAGWTDGCRSRTGQTG